MEALPLDQKIEWLRCALQTSQNNKDSQIAALKTQIQACLATGVASGEVRLDVPAGAMADAVTEMHLAYVERIVSGLDTRAAERVALDAFECLLFGICMSTDASRAGSQRRKRS